MSQLRQISTDGRCSFDEQIDSRVSHARDWPHALAIDGQSLTTGREHRNHGAVVQYVVGEIRSPVDEVLAVVEHEKGGPPAESLGESKGCVDVARVDRLGETQCGQGSLPDERRVGLVCEIDEPGSARETLGRLRRYLDRKAGLPRPADTDDRHERMVSQQAYEFVDLGPSTEELGRKARKVVPAEAEAVRGPELSGAHLP